MTRAGMWLGLALALAAPGASRAQGTVDHLEMLQPPLLVDCDARPFLRVAISPVDGAGRPVGVPLGNDPKSLFQVNDGARYHPIIYVGGPESGAAAGSFTLILFDTSGSMNEKVAATGETRFELAKAAVRQSLATFQDGIDSMAVVPFDSRNVVGRIRAASFQTTRKGVEEQVDQLRLVPPLKDANTALYSSVAAALPLLQSRAAAGTPVSLVLFTDGKNDVNHPGDDPGLYGDEGLEIVRNLAAAAKIPITTVGFGVTGNAAAQTSLRSMAWPTPDNFYDVATSAERLTEIFESTRRKLTDRITVLFGPVRDAREQLSGQSVQFTVKFQATDRIVASRREPLWQSPGVGVPVAETTCSTAETRAIIDYWRTHTPETTPTPWTRVVILFAFAAGLALLWSGVPRLMWPDRYVPRPTLASLGAPPMPPVDRPRMPVEASSEPRYGAPRQSAPPPPPPPAAGRRPSDQTIVVPTRPSPRSAAPPRPRPAPRAPEPPQGGGDGSTVFIPPPRKTPRGDD